MCHPINRSLTRNDKQKCCDTTLENICLSCKKKGTKFQSFKKSDIFHSSNDEPCDTTRFSQTCKAEQRKSRWDKFDLRRLSGRFISQKSEPNDVEEPQNWIDCQVYCEPYCTTPSPKIPVCLSGRKRGCKTLSLDRTGFLLSHANDDPNDRCADAKMQKNEETPSFYLSEADNAVASVEPEELANKSIDEVPFTSGADKEATNSSDVQSEAVGDEPEKSVSHRNNPTIHKFSTRYLSFRKKKVKPRPVLRRVTSAKDKNASVDNVNKTASMFGKLRRSFRRKKKAKRGQVHHGVTTAEKDENQVVDELNATLFGTLRKSLRRKEGKRLCQKSGSQAGCSFQAALEERGIHIDQLARIGERYANNDVIIGNTVLVEPIDPREMNTLVNDAKGLIGEMHCMMKEMRTQRKQETIDRTMVYRSYTDIVRSLSSLGTQTDEDLGYGSYGGSKDTLLSAHSGTQTEFDLGFRGAGSRDTLVSGYSSVRNSVLVEEEIDEDRDRAASTSASPDSDSADFWQYDPCKFKLGRINSYEEDEVSDDGHDAQDDDSYKPSWKKKKKKHYGINIINIIRKISFHKEKTISNSYLNIVGSTDVHVGDTNYQFG